eukprot:c17540_g1_i2 orf=82-306(+)
MNKSDKSLSLSTRLSECLSLVELSFLCTQLDFQNAYKIQFEQIVQVLPIGTEIAHNNSTKKNYPYQLHCGRQAT